MNNEQFPMTKEFQMTNDHADEIPSSKLNAQGKLQTLNSTMRGLAQPLERTDHSVLVIHWSLVIRHRSFQSC